MRAGYVGTLTQRSLRLTAMRTLLLTVFWVSNAGSLIHLLILIAAAWIVLGGAHSPAELSVNVFITQYVPQVTWIKTLIVWLLGDIGRWILALPVLVVSPIKMLIGTLIGYWAYSKAKSVDAKATES